MYVIRNVNKLNLIRLLGRGGRSQLCRGSAWTTRASLALYGGAGRGGNLQRKNTRASPPRGLCTCTFPKVRSPLAPCMRKIGKLSDDMHHARARSKRSEYACTLSVFGSDASVDRNLLSPKIQVYIAKKKKKGGVSEKMKRKLTILLSWKMNTNTI